MRATSRSSRHADAFAHAVARWRRALPTEPHVAAAKFIHDLSHGGVGFRFAIVAAPENTDALRTAAGAAPSEPPLFAAIASEFTRAGRPVGSDAPAPIITADPMALVRQVGLCRWIAFGPSFRAQLPIDDPETPRWGEFIDLVPTLAKRDDLAADSVAAGRVLAPLDDAAAAEADVQTTARWLLRIVHALTEVPSFRARLTVRDQIAWDDDFAEMVLTRRCEFPADPHEAAREVLHVNGLRRDQVEA